MIRAAQETMALDLSASLIIGDNISDLMAGHGSGIGWGVMVATGHGYKNIPKLDAFSLAPMRFASASHIGEALNQAKADGWRPVR